MKNLCFSIPLLAVLPAMKPMMKSETGYSLSAGLLYRFGSSRFKGRSSPLHECSSMYDVEDTNLIFDRLMEEIRWGSSLMGRLG